MEDTLYFYLHSCVFYMLVYIMLVTSIGYSQRTIYLTPPFAMSAKGFTC